MPETVEELLNLQNQIPRGRLWREKSRDGNVCSKVYRICELALRESDLEPLVVFHTRWLNRPDSALRWVITQKEFLEQFEMFEESPEPKKGKK